jgi:hypothetical protein
MLGSTLKELALLVSVLYSGDCHELFYYEYYVVSSDRVVKSDLGWIWKEVLFNKACRKSKLKTYTTLEQSPSSEVIGCSANDTFLLL